MQPPIGFSMNSASISESRLGGQSTLGKRRHPNCLLSGLEPQYRSYLRQLPETCSLRSSLYFLRPFNIPLTTLLRIRSSKSGGKSEEGRNHASLRKVRLAQQELAPLATGKTAS